MEIIGQLTVLAIAAFAALSIPIYLGSKTLEGTIVGFWFGVVAALVVTFASPWWLFS